MCCVTAGRQDVRTTRVRVIIFIFGFVLKWSGSAVRFCSVVLWVEAAVFSPFAEFDGVEGVVDGSAVAPAPGSQ